MTGKYAVITGGTQGLGEAVARLMAARGAAGLTICGRNKDKGSAVAADLTGNGCPTQYVQADLARVEFTARARVHVDELGIQPYLGRWRLDLRRDEDAWKLIAATELNGPAAAMPLPPGF